VAALVLEGPFEVHGGAYQGVDLSKAGDITGKPADGDATSFEELKGRVQLRARRVRIDDLCVRSPKMAAGGYVEIDPERRLAGKLDVSVAKTGGFVGAENEAADVFVVEPGELGPVLDVAAGAGERGGFGDDRPRGRRRGRGRRR